MCVLNDEQVGLIRDDVDRARIRSRHLSHELVDHLCCEVEELMGTGVSFDVAYARVSGNRNTSVLRRVEDETFIETNKRYALMKMTMKIAGNASLAMLGCGTLLKIFHLPGANLILLAGFVLLALVFIPAAAYRNYRQQEIEGSLVMNFALALGAIAAIAGILFKVLHWAGHPQLIVAGWILLAGIFIPLVLYAKLKTVPVLAHKLIYITGALAVILLETSMLFKLMQWPAVMLFMLPGSVLLVSVFLPLYAWMKFQQSRVITARFVYLVTFCMYAIALTIMLSVNPSI